MATFGPLKPARWLAKHIADPGLRVIDFRWYLDGRSGAAAYASGHILGAVFVDLDREVTGHRPEAGRHPLPEPAAFAAAMRRAGVTGRTRVIVYDDQGGFSAARLWWLLRHFGHPLAAVLDGGLQAWTGALSREVPSPPAGDFKVRPGPAADTVDLDGVARPEAGRVLLDARAGERFRGEVEPLDARAGHIPGARHAAWQDNLGADLRFRPPGELRDRFAGLGVGRGPEAVAYCGSGVSACHNLLALEVAGLAGARLYPGSWSQWSSRPGAPVATGAKD